MKKLMTATIIMLPLLILAIMLVSGAIVSSLTHVFVESVEFTEDDTLVLIMDDEAAPPSRQLDVTVMPLQAHNRGLVFSSDDESVVSVDENGVVKAEFYGETYVSVVSSENKAASAKRKVIVTDTRVHKLEINGGYASDMYEDGTQQLSVTVYPKEASDSSVSWSSSDENVLSVSSNGTVTAKGAGTATITAVSNGNGQVSASVRITGHRRLADIETDRTPVVTSLKTAIFPSVTPVPADADITLSYKTDNEDIATVDGEGNIVFKKQGHVTVTVTATDFGGAVVEKKKEYTSTDGYYLPPLFAKKEYTVDYDAYAGENAALPIPFAKELQGSYRQFISVNYSVENVLSFDENTNEFRFTNPMPVGTRSLTATVKARIYNAETGLIADYEDGFTLTVLRNATDVTLSYKDTQNVASITVSGHTLTFTEEKYGRDFFAVVNATPANHTNKIVYSLTGGGDIASITPAGVLTFTAEGTARVRVSLRDEEGMERAFKEADVIYAPLKPGEKEIEVVREETSVVLMMTGGGSDIGLLNFANPENSVVEYTVEEGSEAVGLENTNGVHRIVPVSGGFATVKIKVTPNAQSGNVREYFIRIYVDCAVSAEDFTVLFNGTPCGDVFRTSLGSVDYRVSVEDRQGSMAGKKLYASVNGEKSYAENGALTYSDTILFQNRDSLVVTFGVEYAAEAADFSAENGLYSISRTVTSSNGTLDVAPSVTFEGGTLQTGGTDLTFADIGDRIVLSVSGPFSPADFDLQSHRPSIDANAYVGVGVSADGATVTLTAQKVCSSQRMSLAVGGKTFILNVTVNAKAERLNVTCGAPLTDGQSYQTLLDALIFKAQTAERRDGQPITDARVLYSTDGDSWFDVTADGVRVSVSSLVGGKLRFRSADGGANAEFTVEKIPLGNFGLEFSVLTSSGKSVVCSVESVLSADRAEFWLPSDMQGSLTIKILTDTENLLGGFGTDGEFESIISAVLPDHGKWHADYQSAQGEIIVVGDFTGNYTEEITVATDTHSFVAGLSHINLASVEFTGFDGNNPSQVYLGYQQVRVFAGHSYYNGAVVDYFRVPLVALEELVHKTPVNPALLSWQFTRFNENDASETLTLQRGNQVIFENKTYTLSADGDKYLLKDDRGTTVVGTDGKYAAGQPHVAFVDVLSEAGYARIYFGDSVGLTESDVQNDYFGNFGGQKDWTQTPVASDDGSGRTFAPSPNAFSFLRVQAGDGSEHGINCFYNFNVLADDSLVNVFDADGYYKNDKVVLHTDLYGEGELDGNGDKLAKAEEMGLLLKKVDGLGKSIVYGNGFQINLQAKNNALDKFSESDGVVLGTAYNTVIKCSNPTDVISSQYQKMDLKMGAAYYCAVSYYYKLNPKNSTFYVKNTVFSYSPKAAIQLANNETVYAENIVIVECGTGILVDNNSKRSPHVYFKGRVDVLDYSNKSSLCNLSSLVGALYDSILPNVRDYLEWHEKTVVADASTLDPNLDKLYVNVIMFAIGDLTNNLFVYKDGAYQKAVDVSLQNGARLVYKELMFGTYFALTYEMVGDDGSRLDGASMQVSGGNSVVANGTADVHQLFTDKRYIRLQCEYKDKDEKNFDHIKWHMQRVYRNAELQGLTEDHIEDLKNSLKNTAWGDIGVDGNGTPYDNSAAPSNLAPAAILPARYGSVSASPRRSRRMEQ